MKKFFLFLFSFLAIFTLSFFSGCGSSPERNDRNNSSSERNSEDKNETNTGTVEKDGVEIVRSEFSFDPEKSGLSDNALYQIEYDFALYCRNLDNQVKAGCTVFDDQDNVIYSAEDIKPVRESRGVYKIAFTFQDIFLHNTLKYRLTLNDHGEEDIFEGDIRNFLIPYCDTIGFGPIVTEELSGAIRTSLFVDFDIITPDHDFFDKVVWIRLIPPSQDFFWDIPYETEDSRLACSGSVYDSGKGNYLENGLYILQINLGKTGVIQKELVLTDFFSNNQGPNYGLSVASPTGIDRNTIKLDINLKSKIEYIELEFYDKSGSEYKKAGRARVEKVTEAISKKEVFKAVVDEHNNPVELEKNREYYFKINLHSSLYHNVRYISISKFYKITFEQFGIFQF